MDRKLKVKRARLLRKKNKYQTEKVIGCATKQLRTWIRNKDELLKLSSRKKGK